jgi:hypothetical protein
MCFLLKKQYPLVASDFMLSMRHILRVPILDAKDRSRIITWKGNFEGRVETES